MASYGLPAQAKATPRPDPLLHQWHPKARSIDFSGRSSVPVARAANIIATENGNLLKCVFNDADGTVKLLIREDLFPMAEEGLATAWKKVTTRHSDEDFTTQKGKGKGKAKSSSSTARGVQDYLYKVHLVRVRPLEDDEDP